MRRAWLALAAVLLVCTACGKAPVGHTNATVTPDGTITTTTTTAMVTTTTTTIPRVTIDGVTYVGDAEAGLTAADFELPLRGATGWASVEMTLYRDINLTTKIADWAPGTAFTVLVAATDDVWQVRDENGTEGYVENVCCYLNIADVIPSIVLDNTNSYTSAFLSSGKEIPTITGEQLYDAKEYNPRLEREEYMVGCNWRMVQRIYEAQQLALAAGYTLVINEAFRPMDVQLDIAAALQELYDTDPEVKAGIETGPWYIGWFIANRPSTHQMGCAIDTSLAKVTEVTYRLCGDYRYREVTGIAPCVMPTPIHELSAAAVSMTKPFSSTVPDAWKGATPAKSMTDAALRLREFCTAAGMDPIASEWWHFNDLHTKAVIGDRYPTDAFRLDTCVSEKP